MTTRAEYLQNLDFVHQRLRKMELVSSEKLYSKNNVGKGNICLEWEKQESKQDEVYNLKVLLKVTIEMLADDVDSELFRIVIVLEHHYKNTFKIDKKLFEYLTNNLFIFHYWPYLREITQNMTSRMGIPPVVLPTYGKSGASSKINSKRISNSDL